MDFFKSVANILWGILSFIIGIAVTGAIISIIIVGSILFILACIIIGFIYIWINLGTTILKWWENLYDNNYPI